MRWIVKCTHTVSALLPVAIVLLCTGCASNAQKPAAAANTPASITPPPPTTASETAPQDAGTGPANETPGTPARETGEPASADSSTPAGSNTPAAATAGPEQGPPAAGTGEFETIENPCDQKDAVGLLDKSQEWVYETVCGSTAWFDGFFGNKKYDDSYRGTYGRVGISGFWDQYNGFDPKIRFRGTLALPALRDRAELMVGRGDENELIDERSTQTDTIPGNFNQLDDDSFLIGLGYTGRRARGFKLSIGVKLRLPPEPYVKLRYRKHWAITDSTLVSLRPIVYWKSDEKLGSTVTVDIDQMLSETKVLRWSNYANVAQSDEVEGIQWQSALYLFQALSNRNALIYQTMVLGSTQAEVPLQNYGFELRYRRQVLRKWLFVELITSLTWPRYHIDEQRESNIGIGAGFEMYFGPVPDSQMY